MGGLPNQISLFISLNIPLHLGPLTALVSNPPWHRIHHSRSVRHRDKNFAAVFPVIDIIFRPSYRPPKLEYPATGVLDVVRSADLVEATVAPC
jgi:sterol desaturase/sphingolipid hydroxylase (fatty acid hydroxylase superfamily)